MSTGRTIIVSDLSGAPCPRGDICAGVLACRCSRPTKDGRYMQQFFYCNACGCRPDNNKAVVPIEQSRRRA